MTIAGPGWDGALVTPIPTPLPASPPPLVPPQVQTPQESLPMAPEAGPPRTAWPARLSGAVRHR